MKPIAASITLSILLHSVALAAVLLVSAQAITTHEGVGQGVEVELISSVTDTRHKQTNVPRRQVTASDHAKAIAPEKKQAKKNIAETDVSEINVTKNNVNNALLRFTSEDASPDFDVFDGSKAGRNNAAENKPSIEEGSSVSQVAQSTSASQQQHSIIELLHRRISDNKNYPYLARKQRREGISTIAFMLYPDGSIENTRLLHTSQSSLLDRAALSAVNRIEPFTAAQEYIQQAKEFQIDVVFNLF